MDGSCVCDHDSLLSKTHIKRWFVTRIHSPILLLISGTAKPLILQGRESVSKLLIYGTAAEERFDGMGIGGTFAPRGRGGREEKPPLRALAGGFVELDERAGGDAQGFAEAADHAFPFGALDRWPPLVAVQRRRNRG